MIYKERKDTYEVGDLVYEGIAPKNPGIVTAVRDNPRYPNLSNEKLYKVRWLHKKEKAPKGFMNEDLKPKTGQNAERRGFVLLLFDVRIAIFEDGLEQMKADRLSLMRLKQLKKKGLVK